MRQGLFGLAVVVLSLLVGTTSPAHSRVVRVACRDGVPPPVTKCVAGCTRGVRCDTDLTCDARCTFAIRVCGEVACFDHLAAVPVGKRQTLTLSTVLGARPTRFLLRCLPHPRGRPCPSTSTTTTTTSTSTSVTTLACPTTTTLGVPDCGGIPGLCLAPCRSGQACADLGGGQCGCTGPVLCGGTYGVCGGECPGGQACAPVPVPEGCPSIGCTCQ